MQEGVMHSALSWAKKIRFGAFERPFSLPLFQRLDNQIDSFIVAGNYLDPSSQIDPIH